MQKQIDKIRIKIDKIDKQIIDLLETRLSYVSEVAKLKSENQKISYIKADREYDMMLNLQKYSKKIPKEIIFQIWRNIISFSLFSEKKFAIYFTGTKQEFDYAVLLIQSYFSYLPDIIHHEISSNIEKSNQLLLNNVIIGKITDPYFIEMFLHCPDLKIFAKLGGQAGVSYYAAALIPEQYLVKENYLTLSKVKYINDIAKINIAGKDHFFYVNKKKTNNDFYLGSYANMEEIC